MYIQDMDDEPNIAYKVLDGLICMFVYEICPLMLHINDKSCVWECIFVLNMT